ncbi:MAG TPA: EAL domain-containing protein, partial [Pilimelia sp.]|nr:EAL domain-containing protein [Pilimelia sp.]
AGYHLTAVGGFDRTATALAVGAGALLAVREALAAGDIRRYARRLAGQEAHFRSLVAGAGDLILVLDDDLVVRWQSPAAARLFGLSDQDVVGRPLAALLHPDDAAAAGGTLTAVLAPPESVDRPADGPPPPPALLRARLRDGFGQWRDTESTVSDQRAVPEVGALVLHLRDVGDRRRLERTLHRMAATDQLTALPNRAELMRALAERRAAGAVGALLTVDLSGLTGVNEERGREVGDVLLVEAAQRLRAVLGPQDVAARLAGDEFGVVTAAGPVPAYALGARLLAELTRPYELPDGMVTLQASVGMAELGEGDGAADVLRRADLARRRARQLGRDRLEWYDVGLEEQLVRRMDIERELTGAIPRGELDLAFQPVVHLLDRRPAGVEAFLRWRSPRLGTVLPAEFIPVAEDMGVAAEVADWVLATGCRHLATWLAGGNDVWLAVNMSPRQLIAPDAVARVGAALAAYRVPPERLVVEVAEARLAGDLPAVMTQLAALRALGVRTALDNFGAGQASLAQLRRLPIDILKIDGALVAEPVDRSGPDQPLVDVVVSLGRRLGLELVAEGLETEEGLTEALSAGCRLGQGYVLNRPVPAEHLEAYLENFRAPSF